MLRAPVLSMGSPAWSYSVLRTGASDIPIHLHGTWQGLARSWSYTKDSMRCRQVLGPLNESGLNIEIISPDSRLKDNLCRACTGGLSYEDNVRAKR